MHIFLTAVENFINLQINSVSKNPTDDFPAVHWTGS